jgi:curved DNA-binding protein
MEFKDYYKILGVEKTADDAGIKKAYRKLARKYHPDVSKLADAEARMKEINEAREVLSDVEKRAAYDALGSRYQSGQDFNPPPGWDAGFEFSGSGAPNGRDRSHRAPEDFSDFFASIFGNAPPGVRAGGRGSRGAQSQQMRGEDHHAKVEIDLADAYMGTTRMITLRAARLDETGHVVNDERTLNVKIPKGVKSGQHIRLSGQGSAGFGGGAAGDLFLEIHFRANVKYRVDGGDVTETVPITPWEAMLGATIELDTPSGKVEVKVPPKSQTGRKLRLKGRGIPSVPPGDLYLELTIVLPPADTEKARELYETMARDMAFNPRRDLPHAQQTTQPAMEE